MRALLKFMLRVCLRTPTIKTYVQANNNEIETIRNTQYIIFTYSCVDSVRSASRIEYNYVNIICVMLRIFLP